MSARLAKGVLFALWTVLAACDAPREADSPRIARFDSAGIQIVEYDLDENAPVSVLAHQPTVSFASRTEAFDHVWSFSRGPDGRYLILDRTAGAAIYDSEGARIATLGRFGQGPAEFQQPWRAWWRSDGGVVIYDARGGALLHFSPDYAFERRMPVLQRFSTDVVPLGGNRVLFSRSHPDSATSLYTRDYKTIYIVGPQQDSIVWARTVAGDARQTTDMVMARQGGTWACPYMHEALVTGRDSVVVTERKAPRPTLLLSDVDGEIRRILRRPGPAAPGPSDDQVAFSIAEFQYHVAESEWDFYDTSKCEMPTVAEVSEVLLDPAGDLWMARERTFPAFEARVWDLIGRSGEHRRVLRVHPHFRVLEFGDGEVRGVLTTEVGQVLPLVFAIKGS